MKKVTSAPRNGIIASLDIGTIKTCCLIGRVEHGAVKVIGYGHHGSRGVKAGTIIDMEMAEHAIVNAVHGAELMAGETIESVVVNMSGGHPSSRTVLHEIPLGGHEIGEADIERVLAQGHQVSEPADREVLHVLPVGYAIDGSRGIRDPRGMFGERLGIYTHVISASKGPLRNLATCIARSHLDIDGVVVSPYAAGLAALVEDERELGVTLIDMGGGTTTIAVFVSNQLVFTDSVPIGGQHVTSDVARGLSTPLAHAERMKTLYGTALVSAADERDMIDVPLIGENEHAQANHVPKSILTGIIQPRLEETFELVRSRLEASGFDQVAGRRVVLCGGASQLAGVRDLAALILDKSVRIGRPIGLEGLPEAVSGPAFATAAGLILHRMRPIGATVRRRRSSETVSAGMFGRLGLWLKENF